MQLPVVLITEIVCAVNSESNALPRAFMVFPDIDPDILPANRDPPGDRLSLLDEEARCIPAQCFADNTFMMVKADIKS